MTNVRAIRKEFRALLPLWISCAVAVAVRGSVGAAGFNGQAEALAVLGYVTGSLALGAHSFGHEYSDRTLQGLLVQPVSRRRLLLTKLGVAAVMLLLLNTVKWIFPPTIAESREWPWFVPGLLAFASLSVAPWLTMVCASSIAGIVLTAALPGTLWAMTVLLMLLKDGAGSHVVERSNAIIPWLMLGVCGFAMVETWRRFARLEAAERRADLRVPHWAMRRGRSTPLERSGPSPRRNPVWMLIKKELFLQQMSVAIAALYVLCWGAVALMERFVPDFPADFPLLPITILYFALLSIVIGSLASAEERQFGTLQSQVLLPMPMWRQWMVKVAVVIGLALLLGVALPIALSYVHVAEDLRVQGAPHWHDTMFVVRMTTAVVLLTACGLYLSSLSMSGVHALVLAIPVTFAGGIVWPYLADRIGRTAYAMVLRLGRRPHMVSIDVNTWYRLWSNDIPLAIAAGLAVLLLRLAMQNHRSAERDMKRVVRQAIGIGAYVMVCSLLLTAFEILT